MNKVLIANRGEIARRIIRACRELDLPSVAVYSHADEEALHVREADQAVSIGEPHARKSYLNIERLIAAARESGADAIHPGYGFLSESPRFAEACEAAGITFVGPPASAIAAMGDKAAARRIAQDADVPVVPGGDAAADVEASLRAAEEVGYPVLVKAAAGGGGRGISVARSPDELRAAFAAAAREAEAAFGDPTLYIEKLIEPARHVEVQVLGRGGGEVLHLYERECSLQRRRQKLVEESPSPGLHPPTRDAMAAAADRLAAAVGYVGAGTVEFLVDQNERFYFIEMNTRLQVEHGVTEMVTGIDLVRAQLLIAAGRGARVRAGRHQGQRQRDRVPDQRRGPGPGLPALPGADRRRRAAGRLRGAGRHGDLRRLHGRAVLRLADREADGLGAHAGAGATAGAPRPPGVPDRGHRDDRPPAHAPCRR